MSLRHKILRTTLSLGLLTLVFSTLSSLSDAGVIVSNNELMQCEYQEAGVNEEEALASAGLRGVHAAVGRLLCSNYGLQARELLTPYLELNWKKYVASQMVLDRRVDRDGVGIFVRVLVNPERLSRDLREKKFLYQPSGVPSTMLFVYQLAGDHPMADSAEARKLIARSIVEQGGRVAEPQVEGLSQSSYALKDAQTAAQALETASRAGAEILMTAIIQTNKVSEKEVLYDPMVTYETTATMVAFRKDDGTVMGKGEFVERATDKVAETARIRSIELAACNAAARITIDSLAQWKANYQNGATFRVLLSYADKTKTAEFQRHLEMTMGRGTRAYLKSWYGDVAVFSVVTPCDYATLESAIKGCKLGDMRIVDRLDNRVIVEPRY